jgi:hypothetical protein
MDTEPASPDAALSEGPASRHLRVDGRRRIPLGPLAKHDWYEATVDDQGRITLTPAKLVPAVPYGEAHDHHDD